MPDRRPAHFFAAVSKPWLVPSAPRLLSNAFVSSTESVSSRVECLLEWKPEVNEGNLSYRYGAPLLLAVIIGLIANFGPALTFVHSLTDRLVP